MTLLNLLFLESHVSFVREKTTNAILDTVGMAFSNACFSYAADDAVHELERNPTSRAVGNGTRTFMCAALVGAGVPKLSLPNARRSIA